MSQSSTIRRFIQRLARFGRNVRHLNLIKHRVDVNEERVERIEDALRSDQQRLDQLEAIAKRFEKLEITFAEIQQRVEILETTVTPAIHHALMHEVYDQLKEFQKRLDQEKLFTAPTRRRPKLAFVSPLPPERSGISDYSAELLPVLAYHYEIEVIVAQPVVTDPWVNAYCPVRDLTWFREHASDYERVLYQFGNSPFHSHMFDMLREHPGVIVLHDFFLSSVLAYEETASMPGIWTEALYHSHGYMAVKDSFDSDGVEQAKNTYPCNLSVLQEARSVIVHSEFSRKLARQWYGPHAADDWKVIPHLRTPPAHVDRAGSRMHLGIDADAFVVCSFGFVDPVKHTHRLVEAWLASRLRNDPKAELVLVGINHPGEYGNQLVQRIRNSGCQGRIRITGWVDDATFKQYLQATDLAVQLRQLSRGETSGALLHCLNFGVPTIINANGPMADLPQDVACKLTDNFDDTELVSALDSLWENRTRRVEMAAAATRFIGVEHNPAICAKRYAEAIEAAYIGASDDYSDADRCPPVAIGISATGTGTPLTIVPPSPQSVNRHLVPRQLLVDVSAIAQTDLQTGIERVVRAQLMELLRTPPTGFHVEPVYLSTEGGTWHYRYARQYTKKLLAIDSSALVDEETQTSAGDIFYSPDFFPSGVIAAANSGLYEEWRKHGVQVNFLVHDLLPILKPEFFPEGQDRLHAQWLDCIAANADRLICISNAVANETRTCLRMRAHPRSESLAISVVSHGADIDASLPSRGMPDDAASVLGQISSLPAFLMVGTIEPRKGHLQTLAAFEQLWSEGEQIRLVVVGREGWKALPQDQRRTIPETVDKLQHHAESGARLLWLKDISDEFLEKVYAACACLIIASEGEGFGLPLIEAARHQLPVIARDLPVFREIAETHAFYFDSTDKDDLASVIRNWLRLRAHGNAPVSTTIESRTWRENVAELTAVLAGKPADNSGKYLSA